MPSQAVDVKLVKYTKNHKHKLQTERLNVNDLIEREGEEHDINILHGHVISKSIKKK
jgi:hypothetical protein